MCGNVIYLVFGCTIYGYQLTISTKQCLSKHWAHTHRDSWRFIWLLRRTEQKKIKMGSTAFTHEYTPNDHIRLCWCDCVQCAMHKASRIITFYILLCWRQRCILAMLFYTFYTMFYSCYEYVSLRGTSTPPDKRENRDAERARFKKVRKKERGRESI